MLSILISSHRSISVLRYWDIVSLHFYRWKIWDTRSQSNFPNGSVCDFSIPTEPGHCALLSPRQSRNEIYPKSGSYTCLHCSWAIMETMFGHLTSDRGSTIGRQWAEVRRHETPSSPQPTHTPQDLAQNVNIARLKIPYLQNQNEMKDSVWSFSAQEW